MITGALGICLALTWFLLSNLAVSLLVAAAVRARAGRGLEPDAPPSPEVWLWLRLSPSIIASILVVTAFAPSFLRFEPARAAEPLGPPLALLALFALGLIGWASRRAVAGWLRAVALERAWMDAVDERRVCGFSVPVFVVNAPDAAVTLVGIVKPRLYVARAVADVLTPDELAVVVAHEAGHRARWDNLKRLLLLASPDALAGTSLGRGIAARWAWTAELAADCDAVGGDPRRCVALASALVKVARLTPSAPRVLIPVSALYDHGPLAIRVRQLLSPASPAGRRAARRWPLVVAACAIGGVFLASNGPLLRQVHHITEWLVRLGA